MTTLLLTASEGLGGGIERYVESFRGALQASGEAVVIVPLRGRDTDGHYRLRFIATATLMALRHRPAQIVAMHPDLLPVLISLGLLMPKARLTVVFYGADIWRSRGGASRIILRHLRRINPLTISSFSAGAASMLGAGEPRIVRPALDDAWFERLTASARPHKQRDIDVLMVCRLSNWTSKGVPALLEAQRVRPVGRALVVGNGPVPPELAAACAAVGVAVRCDVTDRELAGLYGRTKVFVLATTLTTGAGASGEGFGIVLIEAQAAGAVVVAPRSGGSLDAFDDGHTGWRQPRGSHEVAGLLHELLAEDRVTAAQHFVESHFRQRHLEQAVQSEVLGPS